jgi:hypothetical protein
MTPEGHDGEGGQGNEPSECTPGQKKAADDGCNTCTCGTDGTWACTLLGCGCTEGATRPAADGCNSCVCKGGEWACTEKACPQTCKLGDTRAEDCNSCVCADFGEGPTWACTTKECAPPAVCKPGETTDKDCNTCQCDDTGQWACTTRTCGTCIVGDTRDAGDGCNSCTCNEFGWVCTQKACGNELCDRGLADCDADPSNGCETNLVTSVTNCGGCGIYCAIAGASAKCVAGVCEIDQCQAPYEDCNGDPKDGCEAIVGDGGCMNRCAVPDNAPAPGPASDNCDCPAGTACVRNSKMNPDSDYCFPLPETCNGFGSCACLGSCVCATYENGACTEDMTVGGMNVNCKGYAGM